MKSLLGNIPVIVALGLVLLGGEMAQAGDKFLLLNNSPDGFSTHASSATVMNYVKQKFSTTNQACSLKVGVACLYYPGASWASRGNELALMQSDLTRAQSLGIPILVQVDTEDWLPTSLLNWYDPNLPGYDPAKTADVDWYGWDQSTAVKLSWRNWGFPFRIGPAPNLLSANFQAYEKGIYDVFLPAVLQWYTNLPANQKWLFVGWKCGWEASLNNNFRFFTNGNSYYGTTNDPPWSDNYQSLGYNAARTAGIATNGTITSSDIARIVGRHLTYLARMASDAGMPRDKIFVHGTYYDTYQQDVDALVSSYGNPGASFYGSSSSPLKSNAAFMQAVDTAETNYGATGYGYGEFNLFTTNYSTWYPWFTNALYGDPDCAYQALYNYDSMYGIPSVEQAMLDAMAFSAAANMPGIPVQPSSQDVIVGANVTFQVTAAGAVPLAYQWRCNGTSLTGAVTAALTLTNVQAAQAGTYTVLVTNSYGSVLSSNAVLAVVDPCIVSQPQSQFVPAGAPATFTVTVGGTLPLGYQWLKEGIALMDGANVSGVQAATLTVAQAQAADVGSYRCVVTNSAGSVTSNPAMLGVVADTYAAGSLTNIPTLAGDAANEGRAITPDGLWVAGVSGARGFLYDAAGGILYNVLDPLGAQSSYAAGVCYRTSGGQQQVIVGAMSAGWNADYCFTNGAFSRVHRDNNNYANCSKGAGNCGEHPAMGLANVRSSGGGDIVWGGWAEVGSSSVGQALVVNQLSGPWQGLTTTVTNEFSGNMGTTPIAIYGVSGTGRAVGYQKSASLNAVLDWTSAGTPQIWSFNGLNGTTAGAAFAISPDGTVIFGQSPVSGGRPGSWPYKAVVTSGSPGVLQSITELPAFTNTVGTSGSAGVPYGCTADGLYAVGTSFRGVEKAVLWNVSATNPTNWTVVDLTGLAAAGGNLNIFTRLARAYSVGTNGAGDLVIAGMGWDTNSPARARAFLLTVIPSSAPVASRPTVTLLGSYPAGFTFRFPTVANASLMYYLEYTTSLTPPVGWTTVTSSPGTGTLTSLCDPNPPGSQRFYRIRVQ